MVGQRYVTWLRVAIHRTCRSSNSRDKIAKLVRLTPKENQQLFALRPAVCGLSFPCFINYATLFWKRHVGLIRWELMLHKISGFLGVGAGVGTTISPQSLSMAYHVLWASGTGNQVSGIKTEQICCGPTRSALGSPLFLSTGEILLQSPTFQVPGQLHTMISRQSAILVVWSVRQSACCH